MRRFLSLFLCILLSVGTLPVEAWADESAEYVPEAVLTAEEPASPPTAKTEEPTVREAPEMPAQSTEPEPPAVKEQPASAEEDISSDISPAAGISPETEKEVPDQADEPFEPLPAADEPEASGAETEEPEETDDPAVPVGSDSETPAASEASPETELPAQTDPETAPAPENEEPETPEEAEEDIPATDILPEEEAPDVPETDEDEIPGEELPPEENELLAEELALFPVTLTSLGNGRLKADTAVAAEGASVTVCIIPDFGHILGSLLLNGEDVTASAASENYTFIMPAEEAVLSAEFIPDPALTDFGSCGESVRWTLSTEGVLRISGSGPMADCACTDADGSTAPFSQYRASIVSVIPENGITRIGSAAFRGCSSLTKVTLPKSVVSIGESAFAGCSALTSLTLPAGLKAIESRAFSQAGLTGVILPDGLTALGGYAFEGCSSLVSAVLPASGTFTVLGPHTFSGCASLTGITVPGNILEIGTSAFSGCTALKTVSLPAYMSSIGSHAFEACRALTSVTLPEGLTVLDTCLFSGCTALADLRLPSSLGEIRSSAFSGCTALTSLSVPESVTRIAAGAFDGAALSALYYRGTEAQWDAVDKAGVPAGVEVSCLGEIQLYEAFYILSPGQQIPLKTDPAALADALQWKSETVSVCTLKDGMITAVAPGTGYISGSGLFSGRSVNARIRIDVTEAEQAADEIITVSLPTQKATVELYKTDYTRFNVFASRAALRVHADDGPEDAGVLLTGARFTDETVESLFRLRVVDDRTLEIIPTSYALAHASSLKSSYSSVVEVELAGGKKMTVKGKMTVALKRSVPTVKAKALTLNSYSTEYFAVPSVTGAHVTGYKADSLPEWLVLENGALHIAAGAVGTASSGTVRLVCTLQGWSVRPVVSFTVKAAPAAPSVRFETSSVTLNPGTADKVTVGYTVSNVPPTQTEISVTAGRIAEETAAGLVPVAQGTPVYAELLPLRHTLTLSSAATNGNAHTYRVYLKVNGREAGYITVKTAAAKDALKLKLTATGTVDTGIVGSAVTLTATPAFFHGRGLGERYSVRILQSKKGAPTVDVTDLFSLKESECGVFTITERTAGSLPKKYTYTAEVSADLNGDGRTDVSKSLKLSVRFSSPSKVKPSATLKASGYIDPLRRGTKVKLTLKLKNCGAYTPDPGDLHFYALYNKKAVPLEGAPFLITVRDGCFYVRENPDEPVSAGTYYVQFESTIAGRKVTGKRIKLPVKQGKVKLSASSVSGTLLIGDKNDAVLLHIGSKDTSLRGVKKVTVNSSLFSLKSLGEGDYSLGWKESTLQNTRIRPKSGSTKTLTLSVFLEGNNTSKPNAKLKLKLRFTADYSISEKIVENARRYANTYTPYSKCDCSRLTHLVCSPFDRGFCTGAHLQWKHVRSSPRWSYFSYTDGSYAPIPAGAIVFFTAEDSCKCGRPGEIHHVAISVGNDRMIDSTNREDINRVSERSLFETLTYHGEKMKITGYALYNE